MSEVTQTRGDIGWAVAQLKESKRVRREGWNGKGMWLALMPETTIPAGMVNERTRRHLPTGDLPVGGYIVMWTAQGVWQPGWVATQSDLLGQDWLLVED